jgi:hypothetical protein
MQRRNKVLAPLSPKFPIWQGFALRSNNRAPPPFEQQDSPAELHKSYLIILRTLAPTATSPLFRS